MFASVESGLSAHGIVVPAGVGADARGEVQLCCPRCSSARRKSRIRCLSVNLNTGLWCCHHCGFAGPQSGEGPRAFSIPASPVVTAPGEAPPRKVAPLGARWSRWLGKRGLDAAIAQRLGFGEAVIFMPQVEALRDTLVAEYRQGGVVLNRKFRTRDKLFRTESGCRRWPFNLDAIGPVTVVVEGELDAVAVTQAGWPAVISVPDGAPPAAAANVDAKLRWVTDCRTQLDRAAGFVLAVDGDAQGQRLAQALVAALGPARCAAVAWPAGVKDANDVLSEQGAAALLALVAAAARTLAGGA